MVATGFPYENGQKTEIIDFINPHLKFEVFADTAAADRAVGGLIQNQPVICGGSYMLGMVSHKMSMITIYVGYTQSVYPARTLRMK